MQPTSAPSPEGPTEMNGVPRARAVRAIGAAAIGYLAGIVGFVVWARFPATAAEALMLGRWTCAFGLLALCGDLAAIGYGISSQRVGDQRPSSGRGIARLAVALGVVGLAGCLFVGWLGVNMIECGHHFSACQSGWTRT